MGVQAELSEWAAARVWSCGGMESVAGFDVGPAVVQLWVSEPGYLSGLLHGCGPVVGWRVLRGLMKGQLSCNCRCLSRAI